VDLCGLAPASRLPAGRGLRRPADGLAFPGEAVD